MSLKNGDLENTVLERFTIDEFVPKSGAQEDFIVVAFSVIDDGPANDLNTFIQRGYIDVVDVEVSPVTDDEGNYLVFVEVRRSPEFFKILDSLIGDIENLTGPQEWRASTYLSHGRTYLIDDPMLESMVITDPGQYMTRTEFEKSQEESDVDFEEVAESVGVSVESFGDQYIASSPGGRVQFQLVEFGPEAEMLESSSVHGQPLIMEGSTEKSAIKRVFSGSEVYASGSRFILGFGGHVAVVQGVRSCY